MSQSFLDREGLLIVVVALVTLGLLGAGGYYLLNPPPPSANKELSDAQSTLIPDTFDTSPRAGVTSRFDPDAMIGYAGQDGETVLDLLKVDHSVLLDSELIMFGSIVLSIDSFDVAPGYYWLYYRDSLRGDRSAEVCTTHSSEQIRWVLQKRK